MKRRQKWARVERGGGVERVEKGQQERRAELLTRASPDKFALLDDLCRTSWQ